MYASRSSTLDATWTYGRRSCVEAIASIVNSVGIESLGDVAEVLDWLIIKISALQNFVFVYIHRFLS